MFSILKTFKIPPNLRNVSQYLDGSTKFVYKPVPRSGSYMLDSRNDRKILEDEFQPKSTDIKLRFELMDQNDIDFMIQVATEHFVKESNLMRHLKVKGEELVELFGPSVATWIESKTSVIVKDENRIVGTGFGNFHGREEFEQLYRGQLFHENPKFIIKRDYAEDIKNGPFKSHNLNRFFVLWEEIEWQTGKFLPENTQKLGCSELISIDRNYMGLKLASKLALMVRKLLQEEGCTHEHGIPVATGTWKTGQKFGHRTLFSLPYNKYVENGIPVFDNLHDGSTAAHSTLMDYINDKIDDEFLMN